MGSIQKERGRPKAAARFGCGAPRNQPIVTGIVNTVIDLD
jgi:hypothetical protein